MDTCIDCRYYADDDHLEQPVGYTLGTCRRQPPVFTRVYDPTVARFPVVRAEQRACGEFRVAHPEDIVLDA